MISTKSKKYRQLRDLMCVYALKRSVIKNANGGKAYMMAIIIDSNYRVLWDWNQ
jgi:hypothetical protein